VSVDGDDSGAGPRSKTVLRPQPGGAGPAAARFDAAALRVPPAPGAAASPNPTSASGGPAVAIEDFVARSSNPLLTAAGPLLTLGASIRAMVYQADIEGLRRNASHAVRNFEAQARTASVNPDDVTIARFIVCAFVDSAVLQTPWGGQQVWGARSLLLEFHGQAESADTFFVILERLRQDPARYIDLLELQYMCLTLGYQGKYRGRPDAAVALQALLDDLYRLIRTRRPATASELSARWQGVSQPKPRAWRLVPWWVVLVCAVAVVLGVLIFLRAALSDQGAPTVAALAVRGVDTGYEAPPTPPPPSRLKQLLAPQEQAGQLNVEEFGKKTVVTLEAPELFASGSANVTPSAIPVLQAVGRALQQVPGRVNVIGHTDDQPLRSFRFSDNFELSRARAVAVAQLLKPGLSDFSRVQWTGLGSTEPRYLPASTPENRARNRRVEIVHQAE
jgi:type VI secretion system protein ImpK